MKMETWKPLNGLVYGETVLKGYEVSSSGKVRSIDRYVVMKNGRTRFHKSVNRKTKFNNRGYEMVSLSIEGREKTCLVHRLVAMLFTSNPKNLPEVNHIDNDKENNDVSNLEWTTSKENHKHAVDFGFRSQTAENGINSKLTNSQAKDIRGMYKTGEYSHAKLAEKYSVSESSIRRIINYNSYVNI